MGLFCYHKNLKSKAYITSVLPVAGLVQGSDGPFSPRRSSQPWTQLFSEWCPSGHPLQPAEYQTSGSPPGRNTRRTTGHTLSGVTCCQNLRTCPHFSSYLFFWKVVETEGFDEPPLVCKQILSPIQMWFFCIGENYSKCIKHKGRRKTVLYCSQFVGLCLACVAKKRWTIFWMASPFQVIPLFSSLITYLIFEKKLP